MAPLRYGMVSFLGFYHFYKHIFSSDPARFVQGSEVIQWYSDLKSQKWKP